MSFTTRQERALKRGLQQRHVRNRSVEGRELAFIEAWHAIAEANRIFGFDAWDRETMDVKCVVQRAVNNQFVAIYTAKVRITVRSETGVVVREGNGSSEGRGATAYEAHSMGLKGAETDATKRALATFGRPFGLSLYSEDRREGMGSAAKAKLAASAPPPDADKRRVEHTSDGSPVVDQVDTGSDRRERPEPEPGKPSGFASGS